LRPALTGSKAHEGWSISLLPERSQQNRSAFQLGSSRMEFRSSYAPSNDA
jgi:hypothetical protein